jgi:hypothetical protein
MRKSPLVVAVIGCVLLTVLSPQTPILASPLTRSLPNISNQSTLYLPILLGNQNVTGSAHCTLYADSAAKQDGSGTIGSPFNTLQGRTDLSAANVLCLRGTTSGAPRAYRQGLLRLSGNGTAAKPITLMSYPGEQAMIQSTGQGGLGVLDIQGDYWHVENLIVDNSGISGPAVVIRSRYDVVRGNEIRNGKYDGIDVIGTDALIEDNLIHHFDSRIPGSDAHCVNLQPTGSRLTLQGNTIHDCSGDGIQAYNANNTAAAVVPTDVRILNNVFYRGTIAYTENAIDTKIGDRFTISGNDISGYGYETPQTTPGGNEPVVIHRYTQNLLFIGNKIHDSTKGVRIHADQGHTPSGITLANNILYHLTGSLALNAYGVAVVTANNVRILNNTLSNVTGYALTTEIALNGGRIQNNLFYASGPSIYLGLSNVTVSNNGYFTAAFNGAAGSSNVTGTNPSFVNPTQDFHLKQGSPAIDKGVWVNLTVDFDGKPRAAVPDLGAYEWGNPP